jgi:putative ABC transport system substrate-binding protein
LAQTSAAQRRIAVVILEGKPEAIGEGRSVFGRAFFGELRRLGHIEGRDLIVERYSTEGRPNHGIDLVGDIVALKPDLIVVGGNLLARAFREKSATIPIVATMSDPIATGMVGSLARPAGNLTGVSGDAGIEIWGKRLQLLKEAVPSIARFLCVGVQLDRMGATRNAVINAAQEMGLSAITISLEEPSPSEYRHLSSAIAEQPPDAIVVAFGLDAGIVQLATKLRLPAIYPARLYADLGGLMTYGGVASETARQLANEVHLILNGVKPGDVPIYQPTNYELVINLRTANELGLTVPQSLLARADDVIE